MALSRRLEATGLRGTVEHSDYLIDRFRVGYQFGGGWKCGCADFTASDACRHTREAAGRRAAQIRIIEHINQGSLDLNSRRRAELAATRATRTNP